jgi:hypothetical protein
MKTFDQILEEAFEAGEARGQDVYAAESGYTVDEMAPDFPTWRKRLGDPDEADF